MINHKHKYKVIDGYGVTYVTYNQEADAVQFTKNMNITRTGKDRLYYRENEVKK